MTYNVFSGMLNPTQSINQYRKLLFLLKYLQDAMGCLSLSPQASFFYYSYYFYRVDRVFMSFAYCSRCSWFLPRLQSVVYAMVVCLSVTLVGCVQTV